MNCDENGNIPITFETLILTFLALQENFTNTVNNNNIIFIYSGNNKIELYIKNMQDIYNNTLNIISNITGDVSQQN